MVDVLHEAAFIHDEPRIGRGDGIGPERADKAHQLLAQGEVVGEGALGTVHEAHIVVAHDGGRGTLLGLARSRHFERIGRSIIGAGITAGAADKVGDAARVDPARDAPGNRGIGILGVRGDDEQAPGTFFPEADLRDQTHEPVIAGASHRLA